MTNPIDVKNETFLKPQEVADIFGISVSQVYQLAKENQIPTFRLGRGTLRIPKSMLDEHVTNTINQFTP